MHQIAVRAIVLKDNRILVAELKKTGIYCVPGGGVNVGESLHDALIREIVEETGVVPEIGDLLFIQQYKITGGDRLEFFFKIQNANHFEQIDLSKTTHGVHELSSVNFIIPLSIDLKPEFLQNVDFANLKGVKVFNYLNKAE